MLALMEPLRILTRLRAPDMWKNYFTRAGLAAPFSGILSAPTCFFPFYHPSLTGNWTLLRGCCEGISGGEQEGKAKGTGRAHQEHLLDLISHVPVTYCHNGAWVCSQTYTFKLSKWRLNYISRPGRPV